MSGAAGSAAGALWYLWSRAARNRVARQAARLRRPRYALGFLLGAAYVWLLVAQPGGARPISLGGAGAELAALTLFLLAARWWLFGSERQALAFPPPEIHLLFPAPLSRRQLVAWKIARAQVTVALSAVIWTTLATRGAPIPWPLRVLAIWALLATLHLHQLGASLVQAGAAEQGRAGARRNILSIALFAAAAAAVAWSLARALPDIRAASGGLDSARALGEALRHPAARIALLPLHLLVAPANAGSVTGWARAMLPALALLAAHVAWVLSRDTAFEEAAVEATARRERRLAARRARRPPDEGTPGEGAPAARRLALPLPARAGGFAAIVWKNLVAQLRALRVAMVLRLAAAFGIAFLATALQLEGSPSGLLVGFLGSWVGLLAVAGPLWVRNDLRLDLAQRDVLRSWPLRGRTIVAAELAASGIALYAAQLAVAAVALVLLLAGGELAASVTPGHAAIALAALLALPALNAASLCIQNALALHFPELGRRGLSEPGGIEAVGLNLLSVLGSLMLLLAALALPAAAALPLALALGAPDAPAAIVLGVLVGAALLAAETALAVRWLGRALERLEG